MMIDVFNRFGQSSGIYAFMNTAWAWPAVESLHFLGLSLLIGAVGVFDLRMLGMAKSISIAALHRLVPWGVLGYLLNVTTGMLFFVSAPDQYLYNPAFQLKVGCLLIAGSNVILFYGVVWPRIRESTSRTTNAAPFAARLCGAISLTAWLGVITFGRLITFYRPPEHWCFWCAS